MLNRVRPIPKVDAKFDAARYSELTETESADKRNTAGAKTSLNRSCRIRIYKDLLGDNSRPLYE